MQLPSCLKIALGLITATMLFGGCVSTQDEAAGPRPDTGRRELPWNTPQGWEQSGVLGGYADQIGTR